MNPLIHTSITPESLADAFALKLIGWIKETAGDNFHWVLSGGKTPSLLFSLLGDKYHKEVPWKKLQFWWGDERMVPADDPESNFGVVNKILFSKIEISQSQIHRIKGETDPEREAERYGLEIKSIVPNCGGWPTFDLIMLGLGEDGHIASIFPENLRLMESLDFTGIALHPVADQQRVTITGKVINNAKRIAFLVTGESKAAIFHEIIHGNKSSNIYPASHIHPAGELHWFVDKSCSKEITDNL
jgi:6-phosphogluconolactonase